MNVYKYISIAEKLSDDFVNSSLQIGMTKPRILYIRIYKSAWQNQRLVKSISLIGQLTVSSLQVATNFEKRHSDVIEAIENLLGETSDEKSANLTAQISVIKNYSENFGVVDNRTAC